MKSVIFAFSFSFIISVAYPSVRSIPLWPDDHPALQGVDKDNTPNITIYKPENDAGAAPVIAIICPGGAYAKQTMGDEGHSVAAWYAKQGIYAVVLKYRLPKKGKWSPAKTEYSTLRDAQRAVQTMKHESKELGIENAKVGVMGFSAGGHLSCMTATRWLKGDPESKDPIERLSSRPDFAFLIYPVISFMAHGHSSSRENLLGSSVSDEVKKRYSGEFNVTEETPPIFLVHANDDVIKVENSFVFYQAMKKMSIPVELHIVSRGGHGFFNGKGWGIPGDDAVRFTRSGGQWPIWTLNFLLEEKLLPYSSNWLWIQRQKGIKAAVDKP